MPIDINLNDVAGLVVQTAAQWAVDGTVYSEQYILITSDELYTNTDQRKYKISNGVSTWAQLDYVAAGIWEYTAIDFLIGQSNPTYKQGRVFWEDTDKALSYYDDISGTSIQIGQEAVIRARNNTGSTITNGQQVYITGAVGQNPTIALAKADAETTSFLIGTATHDIPNNTTGKVTVLGLVKDLNTSAFSEGDVLYLSATTAGAFTATPTTTPSFCVIIGIVVYSHVNSGKILVRPGAPIAENTALGSSNSVAPSQNAVKTYVDTSLEYAMRAAKISNYLNFS